ncbi:DUF4386 domain-containing protein [Halobacillus fulvus]|nr:DUF4386 domain-containing protein [Halobacillus fulvus]
MNTTTFLEEQRRPAWMAGVALLVMTLAAFYAYGYVHSSLVMYEDATATFVNLQASPRLFYSGIAAWGVILLTDLIVSWAFYAFLKPIHPTYARIVGGLRLLYTAVLAVAVWSLIASARLVQSGAEGASAQVMESLLRFETVWSAGLIVFGIHLMMAGYVAIQARYIPKWISILLFAAGASYSVVHSLYQLVPQLDSTTATLEMVLSVPMMVGELGFGLWLLVKAIRFIPALPRSVKGAS